NQPVTTYGVLSAQTTSRDAADVARSERAGVLIPAPHSGRPGPSDPRTQGHRYLARSAPQRARTGPADLRPVLPLDLGRGHGRLGTQHPAQGRRTAPGVGE